MKVSRFSEQQIAVLLKQVDGGASGEEVCRKAGISQQTYYRSRRLSQAALSKRIREIAETRAL
jgi:putative transposase